MEKIIINRDDIKLHNILYAVTSVPDYEMSRYFLLENMPNTEWNEYIIVEGSHCSCYGFDDTKWEAIKYTQKELLKLAEIKTSDKYVDRTEKCLYNFIKIYFR